MLPTCLRHLSPTFTSALPPLLPQKRNLHRHFTPTFTPTKQHQPSAFTDQQQIDYFRKIIPKGIRTGEKGIIHYYI